MASISTDKSGNRRILFFDANTKRQAIRLGKVPIKSAQEINRRIEYLVAAQVSNSAMDADTAKWVASIGDDLIAKLAKAGLVAPRLSAALGSFIEAYIASRTDVKSRTRINMEQTRQHMINFFGPHRALKSITPAEADRWLIEMKAIYAEATIARTLKRARQFFTAAKRAHLVHESPFDHIKPGRMDNPQRLFFVSRETTTKMLEFCPNAEWRAIVALCRFGGLRCPSELLALKWSHVHWKQERFLVHSSKLEHCRDKGQRWVPLFPELRPFLETLQNETPNGTLYVITKTRDCGVNWRTQLCRIILKAGLTPWDRLFQNMRSSRETELAGKFPLHVVTAWLGNSSLIAAKHYLQVTDADFKSAASGSGGAQSGAQRSGIQCNTGFEVVENVENSNGSLQCNKAPRQTIPPAGFEPATLGLGNRCSIP